MSKDLIENSNEIINTFGGGVPYSLVHYKDKLRGHMARSAEEMLEAGRCLIVIKEHEPHGEWLETLDEMDLNQRFAQRMMQAALKFSNASARSHLVEVTNSKTKLFELMVLDDDELDALADGATVSGLTLDEIDRMTSRELRKALREAKEQNKDKDRVLADKNQKIDELDLQLNKRRLDTNPNNLEQGVEQLRSDAAKIAFNAEAYLRVQVREALQAVLDQAEENGVDASHWVRGQLDQLAEGFDYLRGELGFIGFGTSARDDATMLDDFPFWPGSDAAIDAKGAES